MKKILTLLVLLLIAPIIVLADEPKVTSVDVTKSSNVITFSGETDPGLLAVMCKLLDDGDHEVNMKSVEVDNNAFEGTITAPAVGEYTVACANYDGGEITVSEPITITEVTVITYRVTFVDGENELSHVDVAAGDLVTRPQQDPTKDNYEFDEWYEDATFHVVFDFEHNQIYDDTTIYAKWRDAQQPPEPPTPSEPIEFNTVFDGQGGTYTVNFNTDDPQNQGALNAPVNDSQTYSVPAGESVTLTAEPDEGWTFAGWYSVHEEEENEHMIWVRDTKVAEGTEYVFEPTETINLMPVFEDHRVFLVHVNTNGGDPINDIEVNSGDLLEPPEPHKDGSTFLGWYADDTFNVEFDFNEPITGEVTIYARWEENEDPGNGGGEEPPVETQPYEVHDTAGNQLIWEDEVNHTFTFTIFDIMDLSDAELLEFSEGEIDRATYEQIEAALIEAIQDKGELLSVYAIIITDENDHPVEQGPFNIKLAKTEDMEGYENFKLLYVDFDNNFEILETRELTPSEDGNFLVGTLGHLSNYVLVGTRATTGGNNEEPGNTGNAGTTTNNEVTNNTAGTNAATENKTETTTTETAKTNNPKTLDNIYVWVIALIISIIGLSFGVFKAKKLLKN